jgi:hypothetical protein
MSFLELEPEVIGLFHDTIHAFTWRKTMKIIASTRKDRLPSEI